MWGDWGLHEAGANGDTPPMTMEPFDTLWSNGIMARHAHDGRPLGHLHWHPHGEIDSVAVHPDFQRMGVASAMLAHAQANPEVYESSYPIRHSNHLSSAGRAWANADPDYHDPGDQHVTQADDNPDNWGWTAVSKYVPAHVPYTGQNEAEMAPHLETTNQLADAREKRTAFLARLAGVISSDWPKKWKGNHPDIPWNPAWSPNHRYHVPGTTPQLHTATQALPYLRNNNGMRDRVAPGDFSQSVEPWGRYMSGDSVSDGEHPPLQHGWERGTVDFENPLYVPHEYGAWKQTLSDEHGGLTGKGLSQALLDKGHDGIITHDKYGIGEMVDIRPKDQRGHRVGSQMRTAREVDRTIRNACPGCGEEVYFDDQDGWRNDHGLGCDGGGTHGHHQNPPRGYRDFTPD